MKIWWRSARSVDYHLPQFDAMRALHLVRNRGLDIPFIIVSGTIGEELAVLAMRQGATDYLLKDRMARLGQAVSQAIDQKRLRDEARQATELIEQQGRLASLEADVGIALTTGSTLSEMLQLCSQAIVRHLGAAFVRIWALNWEDDSLALQGNAGESPDVDDASNRSLVDLIAEQRVPYSTNDPRIDHREWAQNEGIIGCAGHPLLVDDRLVGVMTTYACRALDDTTLHALRALANQIALGIERKVGEKALQEYTERLKALSRQVLAVQEAERRHLARELHDEIGQALNLMKMNIQAAPRQVSAEALEARLEETVVLIERTIQQVRNLSLDLRPSMLDDLGLLAALRWYLNRQAERAGFVAHLVADQAEFHLSAELETTCFRVAQEALTNILRHGHARHVRVELRYTGAELRLVIRDDGVGFDAKQARERTARGASMGMLGMRERVALAGGKMHIHSEPGLGTTIRASFPVNTQQPAPPADGATTQ